MLGLQWQGALFKKNFFLQFFFGLSNKKLIIFIPLDRYSMWLFQTQVSQIQIQIPVSFGLFQTECKLNLKITYLAYIGDCLYHINAVVKAYWHVRQAVTHRARRLEINVIIYVVSNLLSGIRDDIKNASCIKTIHTFKT